jgi:adenine nucleotide transporter 17
LNYLSAIKEIYQKHGLKGFYNGLLFSLLLVINPTINMQTFEVLKPVLSKMFNKDLALFLAGALSKLVATLITYPMQTLKTVMQSGSSESRSSSAQLFYILKEFGPQGFYKGSVLTDSRALGEGDPHCHPVGHNVVHD